MERPLAGSVSADAVPRAEALTAEPRAGTVPTAFTVGSVRVAPNLVLAPMSGITDSAYRSLVKDLNPGAVGLVVTEFVSIEALARQNLRTHRMLRSPPRERPLAIQLFGASPERMAEAALIAQDLGADLIDVNCGCPVPKVVKKGGGAELMRQPAVLAEIFRALRRVLSVPYSVKLRAGWDDSSRNAVEIARMAEGEGVSMIAVHGRTRQQLYTGRSDWDVIAAVKRAVRVPVIGSGDIERPADALERLATTGVDGIMIGRGTLGHPWIFREIAALRAGEAPTPVGLAERLAAIDMLLERLATDLPLESAIGRARGLACRMIKFVRGGAAIREALTQAPSIAAMRELLAEAADAPPVAALAPAKPGGALEYMGTS